MAEQPPPYPEASAPPTGYPPQQAYPPQQEYPQQQAYPPPQPGYSAPPPELEKQGYPPAAPYPGNPPPPQQATQVTVVTQQPVVVQRPVFREYPVVVTLENGQQVQTQVEYRAGPLTWLVCCLMCFLLWEFGLCCLGLIAFCINPLKDVYHLDPNGNVVGVYKRI